MLLKSTQALNLSLAARDREEQPVALENIRYASSNPAAGEFVVSEDGTTAKLTPGGAEAVGQSTTISANADGRPGEGEVELMAQVDVTIVAADAVVLELVTSVEGD